MSPARGAILVDDLRALPFEEIGFGQRPVGEPVFQCQSLADAAAAAVPEDVETVARELEADLDEADLDEADRLATVLDFDRVLALDLDQVEIIKGASSALYGSSALNGVINLRTRFPGNEPQNRLSVGKPQFSRFNLEFQGFCIHLAARNNSFRRKSSVE